MPLNTVQTSHINGAARPMLETLIKIAHDLDTFVADHDAIQASSDALPTTSAVLDDAGDAPRDDAPNLTGADLQNLRDFSANMSAVLTDPAKQILIGKMVRPLNTVLKIG